LDFNGNYQWHSFYGQADKISYPYGDIGYSLAVHGSDLYVTGFSQSPWTGPNGENPLHEHSVYFDIFVLKLTD
jgi:hypothetical protein